MLQLSPLFTTNAGKAAAAVFWGHKKSPHLGAGWSQRVGYRPPLADLARRRARRKALDVAPFFSDNYKPRPFRLESVQTSEQRPLFHLVAVFCIAWNVQKFRYWFGVPSCRFKGCRRRVNGARTLFWLRGYIYPHRSH